MHGSCRTYIPEKYAQKLSNNISYIRENVSCTTQSIEVSNMKIVYFLFAVCIILQPIAQVLERKGMTQIGQINSIGSLFHWSTLLKIVTNPYVVSGVFLSAIALFFWLATLSHWKISYLYPAGALSYLVLAFLAHQFLGEGISIYRWIGMGIIMAGVAVFNWQGAG